MCLLFWGKRAFARAFCDFREQMIVALFAAPLPRNRCKRWADIDPWA